MKLRLVLGTAVALAGCSLLESRQLKLVAAYNQTSEGGAAVMPQYGPQYQTGGLQYKALCLYESDRYAHVTHYWSYNQASARDDEVTFGDFVRTATDSLVFPGIGPFGNGRGRLDHDTVTVDGGRFFFVKSQSVSCPAEIGR